MVKAVACLLLVACSVTAVVLPNAGTGTTDAEAGAPVELQPLDAGGRDASRATDAGEAGKDAGAYCNAVSAVTCNPVPPDAGYSCELGHTLMTCCSGNVAGACTPLFIDGGRGSIAGVCCPGGP